MYTERSTSLREIILVRGLFFTKCDNDGPFFHHRRAKASVNAATARGNHTPLFQACAHGSIDAVKLLVFSGNMASHFKIAHDPFNQK